MRLIFDCHGISIFAWANVGNADVGPEDADAQLGELFRLLKESDPEDFLEIERDISDIWAASGSAAMNLLLERGRLETSAEDYHKALEYLSALIDHAPDFAAGWNARATVYYFTTNMLWQSRIFGKR
ncbi:MAG: hypothetical protein ABGW81_02410 [Paracoccaceae bacterium]